jgi:4-carboxymuconolactone decarboxylase
MPSTQATDTPVLNLLAGMNADAIEASTLDPKTLMLARIAALVAVDAPPASYLMNLGAAGEVDVTAEEVQGVLAAVAPIVGTPRVVAAAGNIMRALALEVGGLDPEATPER